MSPPVFLLAVAPHRVPWVPGPSGLPGEFYLSFRPLRRYSMIATTSPSPSMSPSATRTSASRPARGASTGISIFIDSMTRTTSPAARAAPGAARIFQTVPATPTDLLKFVLADSDFRWKQFTIPASAFPDVNAYYVVSVLTVRGGKVSENAFPGSTALSATGAAGLVHTN